MWERGWGEELAVKTVRVGALTLQKYLLCLQRERNDPVLAVDTAKPGLWSSGRQQDRAAGRTGGAPAWPWPGSRRTSPRQAVESSSSESGTGENRRQKWEKHEEKRRKSVWGILKGQRNRIREVRHGCMEEAGGSIDGRAGTRSRGRQERTVPVRDLGARKKKGSSFAHGSGGDVEGEASFLVVTPLFARIVSRPAALSVPPTAAARWLTPSILIKCRLSANK